MDIDDEGSRWNGGKLNLLSRIFSFPFLSFMRYKGVVDYEIEKQA